LCCRPADDSHNAAARVIDSAHTCPHTTPNHSLTFSRSRSPSG
jgi:hypothetical protein